MTIDIVLTIREMLLADATIGGIVGTRIYTDFLPQPSAVPAIVLSAQGENAVEHLEGPLGLDQSLIRIYAYDQSRSPSVSLAGEIWQLLAGFRGVAYGTNILEISRRSGIYFEIDVPEDGTDQRRFNAVQNLLVSYHSLCEVSP